MRVWHIETLSHDIATKESVAIIQGSLKVSNGLTTLSAVIVKMYEQNRQKDIKRTAGFILLKQIQTRVKQ
jgi:lipopolysaccharide export system protein LptA